MALRRKILDLLALRLATLSVRVRVLFMGATVAAPALARVQLRLRHRVSKLLLRYGRVYDGGGTWTQAHRRWLAAQRFEHVPTELAYLT